MLLGGHLAEMLYFKEPTTGASNDLTRATKMARMMVTYYGMSDKMGLRTYGEHQTSAFGRADGESRDYSESRAVMIDEEVARIISEAKERATEVLTKYRDALDSLTDLLLAKETVGGAELTEILQNSTGIHKDGSKLER